MLAQFTYYDARVFLVDGTTHFIRNFGVDAINQVDGEDIRDAFEILQRRGLWLTGRDGIWYPDTPWVPASQIKRIELVEQIP